MSWFASNWFFILFVVAMLWMHLRHGGHGGHCGHGDHGNRHQASTPAHQHDPGGVDHNRHAAAKSPTTAGAGSDGHVGHNSTGRKAVV